MCAAAGWRTEGVSPAAAASPGARKRAAPRVHSMRTRSRGAAVGVAMLQLCPDAHLSAKRPVFVFVAEQWSVLLSQVTCPTPLVLRPTLLSFFQSASTRVDLSGTDNNLLNLINICACIRIPYQLPRCHLPNDRDLVAGLGLFL